jgi:hypothetical protein
VEHRCDEGVALSVVAGNGAHRKRVIDGEASRWQRGGGMIEVLKVLKR